MDIKIRQRYRHIKRYRQIAQVLLKHGLGFIIDWLDLGKYLPFSKRLQKSDEIDRKTIAVRIRLVLQELGPTYIKLGQLISTRADILPPNYIEEFKKLQDEVKSVQFSEIEKILIEELGEDYRQKFKHIDEKAKAAASIAQTHKAVLKNNTPVIIKIQRPEIKKTIQVDLEIMENFAEMLVERNLLPDFISPKKIIKKFKETIIKELDFTRELDNISRFKNNLSENPNIIIPEVHRELSSKRLLVMEEIKGVKISQIDDSSKTLDRPFLARLGAKSLVQQILIDGLFHADPHPGNIFVVDEDKIAYIDFGMVGQLSREDQDNFAIMFIALIKKEINIMVDKLLEVSNTSSNIDRKNLKLDIDDLINRYYSRPLKDIELGMVFSDLQKIIFKYHINLPEEYFLLIRAIGVSEGVGTSLDPSFNLMEISDEIIMDLIKDRLKPKNLADRLVRNIWSLKQSTRKFPRKMGNFLNKLVEDDFTINFAHTNLEPLIDKLDIASNRLSISLIISSLIIGSTMILQTGMKPIILGIPLLGFLGYITAGVLGLWLVIAILKSGKF
ncbi:MAG: ABC1 kinase family protein [Halanaerobiales bacterium]